MGLSLCIVAGNEPHRLARTLAALGAAAHGRDFTASILAPNLCPAALSFAKAYAAADTRFSLHETALTDPAHALNSYIHRYAPPANCHVFIDADIEPCPKSVVRLADAIAKNSDAFGATALSASGRSRRRWAEKTILDRGLNRQMFALSRDCVSRLRAQQIYLPLGLEGVGGLIAYLLLTDLRGGERADAHHRLVVAEDAHFAFEELTISRHGFETLRERMIGLARRRVQDETLYPLLKRDGVQAMPVTAVELNRLAKRRQMQARRNPLHWWFDKIALDEIAAS